MWRDRNATGRLLTSGGAAVEHGGGKWASIWGQEEREMKSKPSGLPRKASWLLGLGAMAIGLMVMAGLTIGPGSSGDAEAAGPKAPPPSIARLEEW